MRYTCARSAFYTKALHAFTLSVTRPLHGALHAMTGSHRPFIHGLTMTSVGARLGFARKVGVSSIKASSIRAIVIMTNAVETNRIFGSPLNWCDTFFS
jgi:hypothetical protein